MTDDVIDAEVVRDPGADKPDDKRGIWMRGLWMLIFAVLFELAKVIVAVGALFQFLWMLLKGEKNRPVADLGAQIGAWLSDVSRFLTGASDDMPFPVRPWSENGRRE